MAQQYGMSSIPNATNYLKSIKPIPAPTLNFGAPMSGPGITNFQDYKASIPQTQPIQQPTTPSSGGFSLVTKANASGDEDVVKQALSDIDAGMPMEEFDSIYPELSNKKQIFQEYANDIKAGMPKSEGPKLYPELFGGETNINDLSLGQEAIQRAKNLSGDIKKRIGEVKESATRETSSNPMLGALQPLGTALKTAGSVAGAGFDVLGEGIAFVTPDVVKEGLSDAGKAIWDKTPDVVKETAITAIKEGGEIYKDFKQNNPFLADALEGSGNIASILPIGYGSKAVGKGVEKTGEVLGKGVEKVADTASTIGKTLEEGGEKFRNTLAGLDEREVTALKDTPREEFEGLLKQAKISKDNDYVQNPYNEGAQKANDAFKQLEQNLETSQKARVETLKNSGIEKIETGKVRQDIVKDIEDTFNIQGVNIVDGKIKYKTTPGRESLLRKENIKDYEALKLLENATKSRTPLQMMDNIKKMQNLIYDSPDGLRVSKDMGNLIKRSIGKLNKSFKEQVGADYAKILDDMATDIKLKSDLDKAFKASLDEVGNRGELAMKRLAKGTTTSSDVRNIALKVKERTGVDLIKEARLRQLVMDLVDDPKGKDFFGIVKEGPSGIVSKAMQKAIDLTPFSKEKTALARTQKIPPNNKQNVDSNFNSSNNTNNKKNTDSNTPKIPMGNSGMNDKTLKIPAKTQTIDGKKKNNSLKK